MADGDSLNGKVIVITGASSGFGKGAALKFAEHKVKLVLAARRDTLLDSLVADCIALGSEAIAVPVDVSNGDEMEKLFITALGTFGQIDVWVNDAGAAVIGTFTDVPIAEHVQVIETDLIGTIFGSYHALKHFKSRGAGTLINIASMIGKVPAPYYASYSAAKHGVVGLSAALRQELQEEKFDAIHVCTVMPMAMNTPFFEHAANYSGRKAVPIPPLDEADKVVDIIVDLVSNPKDEVPVGTGSLTNLVMHNLAPGVSESLMGKITHKAQMVEAPPADFKTSGVTEPDEFGTEVHDQSLAK